MKKMICIGFIACFSIISCTVFLKKDNDTALDTAVSDPLNATYIIDHQKIKLNDGYSKIISAPGSTTQTVTSVLGKPVYGNLDGMGGPDAAMVLTHDPGGSGTFYYAVAALNKDNFYIGTGAVLLGDRIDVKNIRLDNGIIVVDYIARKPGDAMAVTPSADKKKHLIVKHNTLKEVPPFPGKDKLFHGWVTIGHEVRSFIPCSQKEELWFQGKSPALKEIKAAYQKNAPASFPYAPVFMALAGEKAEPVLDGFGLDYDASFLATKLVQVFPKGNCKSDLIWIDFPLSGAGISSPLKIKGYARGTWFFEGDFPVLITGAKKQVIAKGYASAKSEWMTELFVPFESVIKFEAPFSGSRGAIVLKKDNPTGKPEFDAAVKIPVFFN